MKLLIFDKNQSRSGIHSWIRSISVNRNTSIIMFSKAICQDQQIKEGRYVMLAQDEDSKDDWYICITDDSSGIPVRIKKKGGFGTKCTSPYIFNKLLSNKLLDVVRANKSATLLIGAKPVMLDCKEWYKIVTAKPLVKK